MVADHYVWLTGVGRRVVKGERSEVREQSPLKETPLSTRLYIAGRDGPFPISLSCHVSEGRTQ